MKKPQKKKKSILTLTLEGEILNELDKIKAMSGEVTSAGAIRYAIKSLPDLFQFSKGQLQTIEEQQNKIDLWQNAVKSIIQGMKILNQKK